KGATCELGNDHGRLALGETPERDRLGNERAGKPKQATAPAKARRARTIRGSGSRRRDRAAGQAATTHHRFENWNDRRAAAKPYFFRSLTRESRRRNLPSRSASSQLSFRLTSARAIPSAIAPDCAASPPPCVLMKTSTDFVQSTASSGARTRRRSAGVLK